MISLDTIYKGVNTLYKYGCSGCASKTRNKWYHLCDECHETMTTNEELARDLTTFSEKVKELYEQNNPPLQENTAGDGDSNSDLECETCGISFENGHQIRDHYTEKHTENRDICTSDDIRNKSKFSYDKHETKKSRRTQVFK